MEVYFDIKDVDSSLLDKPVITLGTFDGVHLGHQAIIRRLVTKAREEGKKSVLVTYEPHPQTVVAPESAPGILTTLEEKVFLLRKSDLDLTLVVKFDQNLARYEARPFVEEILIRKLNVGHLIIGYDHAFGKNRAGRAELLEQAKKTYGFGLEIISPVKNNRRPIKSSRIRQELKKGNFYKAVKMLGHSFPIWGTKVQGKGLGAKMGYPTINLEVPPGKLLPPDGVYAAKAEIDGEIRPGMMYKGRKPTLAGESPSLEMHLFDFEPSAKAEMIRLFAEKWIRGDKKFDSIEELKKQIKNDEEIIRDHFSEKGG